MYIYPLANGLFSCVKEDKIPDIFYNEHLIAVNCYIDIGNLKKNKRVKKMRIKLKLFLFLILFTSALTFTLFFSSCSSPTDPSLLPTVTLTVEGVTSTEAFIKLSTNNVSLKFKKINLPFIKFFISEKANVKAVQA